MRCSLFHSNTAQTTTDNSVACGSISRLITPLSHYLSIALSFSLCLAIRVSRLSKLKYDFLATRFYISVSADLMPQLKLLP